MYNNKLWILLYSQVALAIGSQMCKELLGAAECDLLPSDDECGEVRVESRVVGAEDSGVAQFPWVSLLMAEDERSSRRLTICTGSIISDKYILTAGHCCFKKHLQVLRVGEFDLGLLNSCTVDGVTLSPPSEPVYVQSYTVHPGYSPNTLQNDLCLVQLDAPLQFNKCLSPICLPMSKKLLNENYPLYSFEVAGWGITGETDKGEPILPERIQTLTLPLVPRPTCQWMLDILNFNITDHQLCAGGQPGHNICEGDSGSPLMTPLVLDGRSAAYYLLGVASFAQKKPCAKKLPSVYSNILKYLKWIVTNLES